MSDRAKEAADGWVIRVEVDAPKDWRPFNPATDDGADDRAANVEIVRDALDADDFELSSVRKHFPAGDDLLRAAEEAFVIVEGLRLGTDWELAPSIKREMGTCAEALRSAITGERKRRGL